MFRSKNYLEFQPGYHKELWQKPFFFLKYLSQIESDYNFFTLNGLAFNLGAFKRVKSTDDSRERI